MNKNELTHYGVLGMKWGIRRYQPYPTGKGPKGRFIGKAPVKRQSAKEEKTKTQKKKGLSDKQKKYIKIGAAAATAALVTYGMYKINKIDAVKSLDISKVNPHFKNPWELGSKLNCGNCTIAYDLRKRGMDVTAALNYTGMLPEQFGQFYEGLHSNSIKTMDIIGKGKTKAKHIAEQFVKSYPEGSSGSVYIPMEGGFNHFVSWSIEKGKAVFEDPQNPKADAFKYLERVATDTIWGKKYGLRATRLDDLKPNLGQLGEVVKGIDTAVEDLQGSFKAHMVKGQNFVINML